MSGIGDRAWDEEAEKRGEVVRRKWVDPGSYGDLYSRRVNINSRRVKITDCGTCQCQLCVRLLFLLLLECFVEVGNGTSTVPLNGRLTTSTAFRKETCERAPGKARGVLRSDVAR